MIHRRWKAVALGTASLLVIPATAAMAQTPKAGATCSKAGEVRDGFTCTVQGRRRVWVRTPTTRPAGTTPAGGTQAPAAPAGLRPVPGFDGKTIRIGYLGNVSGGVFANGGKALTTGFNAYIKKVNDRGGIAGKYKVENVFAETEYNPNRTVQKYAEFRDSVVMASQVYGTPNMAQLLPRLEQDNVVGSPISLDARWVRAANAFPNGSTYQGAAIQLIDYYVNRRDGRGKKVCSLYYDSDYGRAGEAGLDAAAKVLPITLGPRIVVAPTRAGATEVTRLRNENCDAVLLTISGEFDTQPILAAAEQLNYKPVWLAEAPSFNNDAAARQSSAIKATMKANFITATDSAVWGDQSVPGMKTFEQDLAAAPGGREYVLDPNYACVWGYVQAVLVVALLEKAVALGDLSRDGIKKAMASLGRVNLQGLYPEWDYVDPAKRVPPTVIQIAGYDPEAPGGLRAIAKNYDSQAAKDWAKATFPV